MRAPALLRRSGPGVIARWSAALVVLALLMLVLVLVRFQLYAVRTGSMEPLFGPRDLVVVLRGEYRQGQPISFAHDGAVITHRFVSVNPDGTYVTAGDANTTADPWVVQRRDVIGGVVASAPQLGYWFVYLKSIPGIGSLIAAVVGIRLLWSIAREFDDRTVGDVKRTQLRGLSRVVNCPGSCPDPRMAQISSHDQ
jgi:signal peptidase I